jgi:hypothetical protein
MQSPQSRSSAMDLLQVQFTNGMSRSLGAGAETDREEGAVKIRRGSPQRTGSTLDPHEPKRPLDPELGKLVPPNTQSISASGTPRDHPGGFEHGLQAAPIARNYLRRSLW